MADPKMYCDWCGCRVEKIKYLENDKSENVRRTAMYSEYRHRVPHQPGCPCPKPNMTKNEVH